MPLKPDTHFQVFLFGDFGCFQNLSHTGGIGGNRFFHEDMLIGFNSCLEVNRAETGWCCQNDEVDAAVDHIFVSIETREHFVGGHIDTVVQLWDQTIFNAFYTAGNAISKGITHRDQFDIPFGRQRLSCGTTSAATTADEPDTNCVVTTCESTGCQIDLP